MSKGPCKIRMEQDGTWSDPATYAPEPNCGCASRAACAVPVTPDAERERIERGGFNPHDGGRWSKIPVGWWWAMQAARAAVLSAMFLLAYACLADGADWHDVGVLTVAAVAGAFVLIALGPLMGGTWGD